MLRREFLRILKNFKKNQGRQTKNI